MCRPTRAGAAECKSPLQVTDQPGVSAFKCISVCTHMQGPEGSCAPVFAPACASSHVRSEPPECLRVHMCTGG